MHCGACVNKVSKALAPFADAVDVTLQPPRAVLHGPHANATDNNLKAAVAKAGAYVLEPDRGASPMPGGQTADEAQQGWFGTYWPLIVIGAYIAVAALAGGRPGESAFEAWMANFMAGFFLVFSAFKLLDLRGFADAYASYDLLAKRWHGYGFVYPFLELALGLAYLFRLAPTETHVATIFLMGFSSLGVLQALQRGNQIQCACLGTELKLPMSTITLVEDVGMAAMAALMLVL